MPAALLVLLIAVAVTVFVIVKEIPLPSPTPSVPSLAPPRLPPGSERFYGQDLSRSWTPCSQFAATQADKKAYADPGLQCTYLTVPLDYANPNGRAIKIGLLRRPASDQAHRIGSLVVNQGGPGESGMSFAANHVDQIANNEIGQRFDFVGFDPRGVGSSEPQVVCRAQAEWDAERLMNLDVDTSPTGVAETEKHRKAYSDGCINRTGREALANIGTRDVARDLEIMRDALGDKKLTYLGLGYGTRIGATYAETFPKNVRAMILDGGIDLAQDWNSWTRDQGQGFQKAFDQFVAWCVVRTDCAVGTDKDLAVSRYQDLVRPLIKRPVPVSGGRNLSYTDTRFGTMQGMYSSDLWPELNKGLGELAHNQANTLMHLSDQYYRRDTQDGSYSMIDVSQSVFCVDYPPVKDRRVARDANDRYRKAAPFLDSGQPPSSALDNCAFWPVPPTSEPHHPRWSPDLPTVMVISTTQDPATPYQGGVNLAHDLRARLLTNEGTQSTAFLQGNRCVNSTGVSYLTNLELPAEGTRCKAEG